MMSLLWRLAMVAFLVVDWLYKGFLGDKGLVCHLYFRGM